MSSTTESPTIAGRRIVLAGNPNCGKSVLFHALSGMYVDVSNYPGTTIEVTQAHVGPDRLLDSPGVYGLGGFNDEERVARDVILSADLIINVLDAQHLQRDLFLTLQLLELEVPMVLALNMMDEARAAGLNIDAAQLQHRLGVPVVPMVAVRGEGLDELRSAVGFNGTAAVPSPAGCGCGHDACRGHGRRRHRRRHGQAAGQTNQAQLAPSPRVSQARAGFSDPQWRVVLDELGHEVGSRGEALLMLEGDRETCARHANLQIEPMREELYQTRRRRADELVDGAVGQFLYRRRLRDRLSWATLHPLLGGVLLAFVLWGMYQVIGVLVAGKVVGVTETALMQERYEPAVQGLVARVVPPASFSMNPRAHLAAEVEALADSGDASDASAGQAVLACWDSGFADLPWKDRAGWSAGQALAGLSQDAAARLRERGLWDKLNDGGSYFRTMTFDQSLPGKSATVLAGEFGLLTHTMRYLIGLLMPLVLSFYLMLALLEDCGYLPRLATLTDRALNAIGLNGRAVIPIILGFGCVTMATITTRLLGTEREKSIASTILNFVIPCSAQLGVIVGILALAVAAGGGATGPIILYMCVIFGMLVALGTLLDRVLPGRSSPLFIELPPLRLPRVDNVLKKTFVRSFSFMREAAPWFVIGSLAVSLLLVTGALAAMRDALAPITENWLRLTRNTADALLMGLVRRDFGAAGLTKLAKEGTLSPYQMTVSLIVITLFVPCIASLLILLKERGWKQAAAIWTGTWVTAFLVGGIVAQCLHLAGKI